MTRYHRAQATLASSTSSRSRLSNLFQVRSAAVTLVVASRPSATRKHSAPTPVRGTDSALLSQAVNQDGNAPPDAPAFMLGKAILEVLIRREGQDS
jgi:hypothetical protein